MSESLPEDFDEAFYLESNPDVLDAVRNKDWPSGGAHYLAHGKNEGRSYIKRDPHYIRDYELLVERLLKDFPDNHELALAKAIGSHSMEDFARSGDIHVDYLKLLGLKNGMSIYDLACGCGKTAQALKRAGWSGNYVGADIIKRFTDHLVQSCPEYKAFVHKDNTIAADDNSLDIIFSNSLFTHLQHEEIYLYIKDSYRALKSNGRLIFSFLEYSNSRHKEIFQSRVEMILRSINPDHLDTFLHKDFIVMWASDARFNRNVSFIDGDIELSSCGHYYHSLAILCKD